MNSAATATDTCEFCGIRLRSLLLNMKFRGAYHRLCPGCVLANYASYFCPHCFDLHSETLPPAARIICTTCPSKSHVSCTPATTSSMVPIIPYRCPRCSDGNFKFFDIQKNNMKLDKYLAKQLRTAAMISSKMANKELESARVVAEAAAAEAVVTNREAKVAINAVVSIEGRSNENQEAAL